MKRLVSFSLFLALLFALVMPMTAFSADTVTVTINGNLVVFPDQQPLIQNGRTFIPVRTVSEYLGATVGWNGDTKTVTIYRDKRYLAMTIGNTKLVIDDQKTGEKRTVQMDVAPFLLGGRTMVPVRFVAEAFDGIVDWDAATRTVIITAEIPEQRGNSLGNQSWFNSERATVNDEYVFFRQQDSEGSGVGGRGYGLYRINKDGTNKLKLYGKWVENITVFDDWVYFCYWADIFKVKYDGSSLTKLYEAGRRRLDDCGLCVVDDFVYFVNENNEDDKVSIDKMSIYGGKVTTLYLSKEDRHSGWCNFCVSNEWIYFSLGDQDNGIYKMTTDGNNLQKLSNIVPNSLLVYGGWIYYTTDSNSEKIWTLYRMSLDGSGVQTIATNISSNMINMDNDWIYYTTSTGKPSYLKIIARIRHDGSSYTEIFRQDRKRPNSSMDFAFFDDIQDCVFQLDDEYLYFGRETNLKPGEYNQELWRVKKDGTELELITNMDNY